MSLEYHTCGSCGCNNAGTYSDSGQSFCDNENCPTNVTRVTKRAKPRTPAPAPTSCPECPLGPGAPCNEQCEPAPADAGTYVDPALEFHDRGCVKRYGAVSEGMCACEKRLASMAAPAEAVCPGPDCMMCTGEACDKCGAGCWSNERNCTHDVVERHEGPDCTGKQPATWTQEQIDQVHAEAAVLLAKGKHRQPAQVSEAGTEEQLRAAAEMSASIGGKWKRELIDEVLALRSQHAADVAQMGEMRDEIARLTAALSLTMSSEKPVK